MTTLSPQLRLAQAVDRKEALLEEMRKRESGVALSRFRPHVKQAQVIEQLVTENNGVDTVVYLSGNRGGKTEVGAALVAARALGRVPWDEDRAFGRVPAFIVVCGMNFDTHLAETVIPKLLKYLPETEIVHRERKGSGGLSRITLRNGSRIKFMSYEQHTKRPAGAISPYEGFEADMVWNDEPPDELEIWTAQRRGLIDREGVALFTFTPLSIVWPLDELLGKSMNEGSSPGSGIWVVKGSIHDNPYVPEDRKRAYLESLPASQREAREHGTFQFLQGRIYPGFSREEHVLPTADFLERWEPSWPCGYVVDPHTRKPFAMGWWTMTPADEMVIVGEWPLEPWEQLDSNSLTLDDYFGTEEEPGGGLVRQMEEAVLPGGPGSIVWRVGDPNFTKSSGPNLAGTLEDAVAARGYPLDCTVQDAIDAGHLAVEEWLSAGRLKILDRCRNFIHCLERYVWKRKRVGVDGALVEVPAENVKDFPDLLRYARMAEPFYFDPETQRSRWKRHNEALVAGMSHSGLGS